MYYLLLGLPLVLSLGQGISAGCGLALGYKYSKLDNFVNVVVGDGELQEGQVWEALMFASHNSS